MLKIEQKDTGRRVCIEADMTIYTAAELKSSLQPLLMVQGDIEINLAKVHDIDSAGIQLLMLMKAGSCEQQLALTLTGHSAAVLDAFELMGLTPWFNDPVILPKGAEHGA